MLSTTGRKEFNSRPMPIRSEAIESVAARFNDNTRIGERDRIVRREAVPTATSTALRIKLNKQPKSRIGRKILYNITCDSTPSRFCERKYWSIVWLLQKSMIGDSESLDEHVASIDAGTHVRGTTPTH